MRWSIVGLIFRREVRDQLRDRRTLFMILVLPLLLYPMMGLGVAKLSEAFEQKPRTVVIVGAEYLPGGVPLLSEKRDGFDRRLFEPPTPEEAAKLEVKLAEPGSAWSTAEIRKRLLRQGE